MMFARTVASRYYKTLGGKEKSFALTDAGCSGGTPTLILLIEERSMNIHVLAVAGNSQYMGMQSVNIAATNAMSLIGMEGTMEKNRFNDETLYQVTMSMARKLFDDGVIDAENYKNIQAYFLEKYQPIIGSLCPEMS